MNFWMWNNATDYGSLLEWMREEFYKIEEKGERVLVIGHIPMGDIFSDSEWARRH